MELEEYEIAYFGMWADLRKNFLQEEKPEDLTELLYFCGLQVL